MVSSCCGTLSLYGGMAAFGYGMVSTPVGVAALYDGVSSLGCGMVSLSDGMAALGYGMLSLCYGMVYLFCGLKNSEGVDWSGPLGSYCFYCLGSSWMSSVISSFLAMVTGSSV